MFYSKSTGGFYTDAIHGARRVLIVDPATDMGAVPLTIEIDNPDCKIPMDAVEISQGLHVSLLEGQSSGKVITCDVHGFPLLADPEPTPLLVLIEQAKAKVRTMRVTAFSGLAGIQSEALANGDTKTAKAICSLQDQLRTITDIDLSDCKTADDIDAAFASAWLVIAAAAPPAVASAFNGVQP